MGLADFAIYPFDVGTGQIALSPIPGRSGSYEADLSILLAWAPDLVLSMTTQTELDRMGADDLGADLGFVGTAWQHLPIIDFGTPDENVTAAWPHISQHSADVLAHGGKILVHCFGGCGRSGMVALRLMIEAGEDADAAVTRLRLTRPCAVETDAQKAWAFMSSA